MVANTLCQFLVLCFPSLCRNNPPTLLQQEGYLVQLFSWDTTCKWGRLFLNKGSNQVNEISCDWVYSKDDWQEPQPVIKYPNAKEESIYTVFAIDPDAPDHPNGTYYLHMLQANIKGSELAKGDFSNAKTIASYVGPAPPPGTGLHRYMFVVYLNSPGFLIDENLQQPVRWMFDLEQWLGQHGGGLIGPEAGIQFRSGP